MRKFLRYLKLFGLTVSLLILILCFPYLLSPIYNFSSNHIFTGDKFYNPYSGINSQYIKSNFHAHTKAFFGLTAGNDEPDSLWNAYKKLNYDLLSISNYHSLTPRLISQNIYIPNYEHGINLFKNHFLMIGARSMDYFNFFFYQTIHQKQFQINRLKDKCKFLVITHPKLRSAYSSHELANLNGYDALEIYSRFSEAEDLWDSVLSSGRCVWGFNDDDSHDMSKYLEVGSYWNNIYSSSEKEDDIIKALKSGRFISVKGKLGGVENIVKSLEVKDFLINIELEKNAKQIKFIGQNGIPKKIIINASTASYVIQKNDTYIRIVVENDSSLFYFNPIFRYKNKPFDNKPAIINYQFSIVYWLCFGLIYLALVFLIIRSLSRVIRLIFMNRKNISRL